MNNLMKKDYKVVEKTKWFSLVSLAIVLLAVILGVLRGVEGKNPVNIGIDFTGGAMIEFEVGSFAGSEDFQKKFDTEMRSILKDNYSIADEMQISPSGSGYTLSYRLNYYFNGSYNGNTYTGNLGASAEAHDAFIDSLKNKDEGGIFNKMAAKTAELAKNAGASEDELNQYTDASQFLRITDVGASASATLLRTAIIAIVVALVVILVYIIIRFTFLSGLAAILALIHDVLIMVALTTIFYIPVNSTFVAAVITIIGYSINASIVIFDKIRECKNPNNTAFALATDAEVANYSIKHSFVKIFLSTVTTLIMVVAVVLFSVATIQEFVLPIIFGLISGLFSALCLSPTLWVAFRKAEAKRKANKKA